MKIIMLKGAIKLLSYLQERQGREEKEKCEREVAKFVSIYQMPDISNRHCCRQCSSFLITSSFHRSVLR